jgi:DNA-binding response OmpR family regulator
MTQLDEAHRVLVVDDEKSIRLTLREALTDAGLPVTEAADGDEALRALDEEEAVWLMLLDLKMPGTSGMEVLRAAHEREGAERPHVAIITAHGTVENAVEAMKLGATDFIQKPFSAKEIRAFAERMLRREDLDAEEATGYDAHLELARRGIERHQLREALGHVRAALGHDDQRPEAHNLLGVLYEAQGDRHEAQNSYREALELDPGYEAARVNLRRSTDSKERQGSFMLDEAKRADVVEKSHRKDADET